MFVIQINEVDSSCHTKEADALEQKQRFIASGIAEEVLAIVEKDTFSPSRD